MKFRKISEEIILKRVKALSEKVDLKELLSSISEVYNVDASIIQEGRNDNFYYIHYIFKNITPKVNVPPFSFESKLNEYIRDKYSFEEKDILNVVMFETSGIRVKQHDMNYLILDGQKIVRESGSYYIATLKVDLKKLRNYIIPYNIYYEEVVEKLKSLAKENQFAVEVISKDDSEKLKAEMLQDASKEKLDPEECFSEEGIIIRSMKNEIMEKYFSNKNEHDKPAFHLTTDLISEPPKDTSLTGIDCAFYLINDYNIISNIFKAKGIEIQKGIEINTVDTKSKKGGVSCRFDRYTSRFGLEFNLYSKKKRDYYLDESKSKEDRKLLISNIIKEKVGLNYGELNPENKANILDFYCFPRGKKKQYLQIVITLDVMNFGLSRRHEKIYRFETWKENIVDVFSGKEIKVPAKNNPEKFKSIRSGGVFPNDIAKYITDFLTLEDIPVGWRERIENERRTEPAEELPKKREGENIKDRSGVKKAKRENHR